MQNKTDMKLLLFLNRCLLHFFSLRLCKSLIFRDKDKVLCLESWEVVCIRIPASAIHRPKVGEEIYLLLVFA